MTAVTRTTRRSGARVSIALSFALVAPVAVASAQVSALDRQRLIAHLEMTEAWMRDEVSHLSPAQAAFRPAKDAWSVLDVLDHLVVVGPIYWEDLQKALRAPAGRQPSLQTDADILWYGVDRTHRETAIAPERPSFALRDVRTALAAIADNRARLTAFVRTTTADLRRHLVERQGCDAYQWALLITTHEQRHILQIREIKAAPAFPSK